ncbi:tyrosine-type recombinase/integrase [Methylobacterium soli]|uniref:DUF4102 domain-containing protein n=1 Tax=Methylobacterium soli TaxID=553447 RepID=A0A6L3SS13_9HYPH|nr:site-specific integrase [Methylobacterium soli]KAB1075950.1 DUF4102 domain-containing protein [Methylobacterium soli]GJE45030.1 Prophage integrase IntS [Methylobacterium soli]
MGKLTAKQVDNLKEAGTYEDGEGLRLVIGKGATKRWVFRYQLEGKRREMGLGPFPSISLKGARDAAAAHRAQIAQKIDPLDAKRAAEQAGLEEAAKVPTFRECAEEYIAAHRAGWKNGKHAEQWTSTLKTYAYRTIGAKRVDEITTAAVLTILTPIWQKKPETASRVRGRIELILDAAKANDYRSGENPARWRGHLDKLLPARSKVRKVVNQPAMPREDVPAFMVALSTYRGGGARALQFTVLTACRSSEVLNATWSEIDLDGCVWTIPAERMKGSRVHRVPLTLAMMAILQAQQGHDPHWVFPGRNYGRPLCNMTMLKVMRDMGLGHFVPHGFRSTFRDWAAECTNFPRDVCEMALAHAIENSVEAAYRRGDLFEKRQSLMSAWSDYAAGPR